jgi:tetrahydromethanopterin S-methyltransferase subunit G
LGTVEIKMDAKFEEVDKRFDKLERGLRQGAVRQAGEARFDKLGALRCRAQFDKLEARFDVMEGKFDQLFSI